MKVSQMIQSKFLRKDDIEDDTVVTIKSLKLEDMPGDSGEQRWTLYFNEQPKGMVVNNTTLRVLEKSFGDETDGWAGKKVTLYVDPNVTFKGQVVGGLRLRPVKGKTPPKPSPLVEADVEDETKADEFDDVIP